MTDDNTQQATALETETCGRCCGTGQYSFNLMHGSRCYGCGGSGKVYTKRGKAASNFLQALRSVRADSLKPGDLVDINRTGKFHKVTEVVTDITDPRHTKQSTDGGKTWFVNPDAIIIYCGESSSMSCSRGYMVRKGFTAEEKQAQFKQALEYQATLTKAGTVRKGRK